MRIVPSDTPPVTGVRDGLEVQALTAIKPVKPVQARTLVPLLVQPHREVLGHTQSPDDVADQPGIGHDPHIHGERRLYCRRVQHLPILIELRSGPDRRRHDQRDGKKADHIDVKV